MPCAQCSDARRCETVCQASMPWVPLTSEEIWQAIEDVPITKDYVEGVARAVERAVWAKNGPRDVKEASAIQCTQCLAVTNEGNGCAQEGCPVGVPEGSAPAIPPMVDRLFDLAQALGDERAPLAVRAAHVRRELAKLCQGLLKAPDGVRGWSDEQIVAHLDAHGVAFAFHPTALIAAIRALPHGVEGKTNG